MKEWQYLYQKIKGKLLRDREQKGLHRYFRDQGIQLGDKCKIYSNIVTSESCLITIGDRVTISSEVLFLTHDNSVCKCLDNATDLFGKIKIGSDCFIGARSILMYGVTLADHIIVGAGSVVTHSFLEEGIIIGGSPARRIGLVEDFSRRAQEKAWDLNKMTQEDKEQMLAKGSRLVER